ncbi:MAG TPA: hypothetical protein DCQ06_13035 [Myxococcales bacterium]|nr:hypothetical protein [Myxococcales bacterium]HAN32514.1 hypothetical protein [Myxococcales bacterium]
MVAGPNVDANESFRPVIRRTIGRLCVLVVSVATLISSPSPTSARDMSGKGGIGIHQSTHPFMSSLPMLMFRYWGRKHNWELGVGFDLRRDRGTSELTNSEGQTRLLADVLVSDPNDSSVRQLFIDSAHIYAGVGYHRLLVDKSRMSLTLGGRMILQLSSSEITSRQSIESIKPELVTALAVLFEIPLQVEFFLTDHSSITAAVSLSLSLSESFQFTSKQDGDITDLVGAISEGRGGLNTQLGGNYSGGVGYTFYF